MPAPLIVHWQSAAALAPLHAGAVHVWGAHLDRLAPAPSAWLDAAERQRRDGICGETTQRRFLATRRLLRVVLADYLGATPAAVGLATDPGGKPRLAAATTELQFNLTHCGELALLAVARCPVGIDVERRRAVPGAMRIAHRLWSAATVARLGALPEDARADAFLRLWTAFEAQQKARGEGVFGKRHPDGADVLEFAPDAAHVAALAWQGAEARLQPCFLRFRG